MLLHREEYSPTLNQSIIVGYWENIFTDDVKTPAEVYAALKDEGYDIEYQRIPLTREKDALASDVDAIQYSKDDSTGCYIFVSHTGFGGVAYAMAIICIRVDADGNVQRDDPLALVDTSSPILASVNLSSWASGEAALKLGEYRDILSLTRVLAHGPRSKEDVDNIIER